MVLVWNGIENLAPPTKENSSNVPCFHKNRKYIYLKLDFSVERIVTESIDDFPYISFPHPVVSIFPSPIRQTPADCSHILLFFSSFSEIIQKNMMRKFVLCKQYKKTEDCRSCSRPVFQFWFCEKSEVTIPDDDK